MAELKTGYKKGRTRNKKWKISVRFRHQRIKLLKAKNLKYIHANKDNSNENNISPQEMYEKAQTGYAAAKQTSGVIYTAAGRAGKNAGRIFSQVKNHQSLMRTGNIRDAGRIFTRVNKTVENGIKSGVKTGTHKALQSRTDKSKITDTGAETINQALTEMRYTANAGKAVINTSRTTVKAVTALRNMPRDTRIQVRAIKKNCRKNS